MEVSKEFDSLLSTIPDSPKAFHQTQIISFSFGVSAIQLAKASPKGKGKEMHNLIKPDIVLQWQMLCGMTT